MKPQNTLFIFSDEHTREITGCYGNDIIQTPNIDALAASGTRFDNAYTNCPICVPARASLATGRYVHDIGYWDNAHPYFGSPNSFGHRLISADHNVTAIGKLHYRSIEDSTGWNQEIDTLHVVNGIGGVAGSVRKDAPPRDAFAQLAREAGRGDSTYIRYDASTAAHAVRWLKEQAPRHTDRPWTLFLGFVLPHFPLIAPPEFYDRYLDLPAPRFYAPDERPQHPVVKEMARVLCYDDAFDEEKMKVARTAYFGMVSYLDHCIGQVIGTLEETGLRGETRIIYTTDHGDNIGHRGLWGKSNMYEESAAIPMILSGADIPRGKTVDTPVSLVDCYQTLLEGAGVELTEVESDVMPGHSLVRIANGEVPARTILSEYHAIGADTGVFMIRHGDFKYVHYVDAPPQLFDLTRDPHEAVDLAAEPEHAQTLATCEQKLRALCNPEAVNEQAFADQAALLEKHGGREAVLARGDFGYTPAPGEAPKYN